MPKRVIWLLSRGDRMVNEDGAAGQADIMPGMLVSGSTTIIKQAVAGENCMRRFALEREEMGKTIDTVYASGDKVKVGTMHAGDRVNALLANAHATITAGTFVEAAGDGTVRTLAAGTRLGQCLETVTGPTSGLTRIRIEILMWLLALGSLLALSLGMFGESMAPAFAKNDGQVLLLGSLMAPAVVNDGRTFLKSAGRWATEQLVKSLKAGKGLTINALRTADTLLKDEWIAYDTAVVEEGKIRLRGIADLVSQGLTQTIPNGLGKTLFQYETITDMEDAIVSMTGVVRSENDRPDMGIAGVPLPITHKDFNIDLRHLEASRQRGEGLDVTSARIAGRKCSEKAEEMLFIGGPKFAGFSIYGYTTHPSRNTTGFGTNGNWAAAAKTGADILADVQSMLAIAAGDRFYGPFVLYVDGTSKLNLTDDFKTTGDKSTRERLLELDEIVDIRSSDKLPANNVVLVQMSPEVVTLLIGEELQTVQWDLSGGFEVAFKALQIMVPLLRADPAGRSGIVHMS